LTWRMILVAPACWASSMRWSYSILNHIMRYRPLTRQSPETPL
jgi:hypothetical protein